MHFLLTTDGSENARAGAAFLAALPLASSDTLTLMTVIQPEERHEVAQQALDDAETILAASVAARKRLVRRGNSTADIVEAIVWAAEEVRADVIVIATRGRSALARFLLGSVAERVAQYAPCSVLAARPLRGSALDRVLVGVDGSAGAASAVSLVEHLPLPSNCDVRLADFVIPAGFGFMPVLGDALDSLRAGEQERARRNLEETAAALAAAGRTVSTELREGDPATGLIDLAAETGTDLVTVGARGDREADRFLIGSVSARVLRHAPCSVLVARPQERWT
jgi:nucleotide-binding universal stress UspA family protein